MEGIFAGQHQHVHGPVHYGLNLGIAHHDSDPRSRRVSHFAIPNHASGSETRIHQGSVSKPVLRSSSDSFSLTRVITRQLIMQSASNGLDMSPNPLLDPNGGTPPSPDPVR